MSRLPNPEDRCIIVYGNEGIADRNKLSREFNEFGKVTKIFIENSGKYSKIYFETAKTCKEVVDAFKVNHLGWIVEYPGSSAHNRHLEISLRKELPPSGSSIISSDIGKDTVMDFSDEDEVEFTQNCGYCTLHGDPVVVLTDESGELYVKYKDVKKAGFALFRRDNFDSLLMDRKQVSKEFELFLLAEARNYLLKRKLNFSEEEILSTIARCREKVLSDRSNTWSSTTTFERSVNAAGPNLTITSSGRSNGMTLGAKEESKGPRTPHTNFQLNKKSLDRNDQSLGSVKTGSDRKNGGRSQSRGRPNRSNKNINNFENINDHNSERNRSSAQEFGKRSHGDQDSGRNRSDDNEFGKTKPDKDLGRSKQANNGSRNNQEHNQKNRVTQPRRQYTNSNAILSSDECSSVRSDSYMNKPVKEEIEIVTLRPGNTYDVVVSYVDNEKVQWVQTEEYNKKVLEMTLKLLDAAPLLDDIVNPIFGQLVLALFEDVWYRAQVINQEPLVVHYLDYGNKNKPSALKLMPEEYKNMPATAMRTTGLQKLNMTVHEDQKLRLNIKQQYDDGTYLVNLDEGGNTYDNTRAQTRASTSGTESKQINDAAEIPNKPVESPRDRTPRVKSVERRPANRTEIDIYTANDVKPLFKLKNDEPVKMIGRKKCQLLVRNKECYEKLKELNEYIKNLDKSTLTLSSVKEGQLVLAKEDGAVDNAVWHRAAVVSKESCTTLQISYIDFPGEDALGVKSLRNVDEYLAAYPALMTITPAFTALEDSVSSAMEYVDQLIQEKAKMIVVVADDAIDLKFEDGTLLSKTIFKLNRGSSKELPKLVPIIDQPQVPGTEKPSTMSSSAKPTAEPSPTPKPSNKHKAEATVPFTLDLMDWTRLSIGVHDVIFYTINDVADMTVGPTDEKSLEQLEQLFIIQVKDDTPYEPVLFEMCLVAYKSENEDESSWTRAFITSIDGEEYTATCVDFGNEVSVTKNEIRMFPMHLKDIPMMGINCECVGIPNNDKVLKELKELLPEGTQAKIKVIECIESEMKFKIEIPHVYEYLRKRGVNCS